MSKSKKLKRSKVSRVLRRFPAAAFGPTQLQKVPGQIPNDVGEQPRHHVEIRVRAFCSRFFNRWSCELWG